MKAALIINLLLVLLVVNGKIFKKNRILEDGQTVYLKLAPRDPRSLMQGDYMVLRLDLLRDSSHRSEQHPTRGRIVLKLEPDQTGTFARFDDGIPLKNDETLLKYRRSNRGYLFGLESFFFEEGNAEVFESARFAEVMLQKGNAVLVDLVDEDLNKLKPKTE